MAITDTIGVIEVIRQRQLGYAEGSELWLAMEELMDEIAAMAT